MGGGIDRGPAKHGSVGDDAGKASTPDLSPGKRTLTESLGVQRSATAQASRSPIRSRSGASPRRDALSAGPGTRPPRRSSSL